MALIRKETALSIALAYQEIERGEKLLADVSPHTLRHTAATWLEEGDVDMGRISRLLGHRDRRTTEKLYSKPRPAHLQGAADIIDMKIRRKQ